MSSEVKVAAEPEAVVEAKTEDQTIYVDASEQIAGRMCSIVARELLAGKRVVVLNAEKALVSGKTQSVFRQWQTRLEIYSHVNPIYGPIHPRRPDNIVRRMVRGMVPKTKPSGKTAMNRLRVYMGVPEKYVGIKTRKFDDAMARRPIPQYVTIAQISKNIGWND
ncbi:MAG: 50S ribosomal protein L13 [Thaumarchaeota archaeon]|nr:50S ribosomal protein L13 [Nitrososphaerota archaeon]